VIAKLTAALAPELPIEFVWVGSWKRSQYEQLLYDVERSGLATNVKFTGHRLDAPDCFAAFDVLALTSREDSYPLVVVESALLGVPTVCFDGGGGAPEFVRDDAGIVVPYLDAAAFAEALVALARDPQRWQRAGRSARERALDHSMDRLGPQVLDVIYDAVSLCPPI
jgi:glycosyltransferase involved in cell wall biosynthesis